MKYRNKGTSAKIILVILSLLFCSVIRININPLKSYARGYDSLERFLLYAKQEGFCYKFEGDDQNFDGNKVLSGTEQDIMRLKNSTKGTIIVRYKSQSNTNQVLFAAGKNTSVNNYGAVLANCVSSVNMQRIDFPGGMVANLNGPSIGANWHTFVYSVDAENPSQKNNKTVTSIDGSTTTQYPNYASWFNYNSNVNDINFFNIGGVSGNLANSSNNTNFVGQIAFIAFVPDKISQDVASNLSSANYPGEDESLMYINENLDIHSSSSAVDLSDEFVDAFSSLEELSIIVKYRNDGEGIGSLFSVSDTSKVNHHFHVYEYGNILGFEFRNNDNPKYSGTCAVHGGEYNTIAFKAEKELGYKLFANGILGSTVPRAGNQYQFLSDLSNLTSAAIGKLVRSNNIYSYPFSGEIEYIEIYNSALSDEYLLERTRETQRERNLVFYEGDTTGSTFFRIPFLLSSSNGTLIAGTDANYGSTGDSAENIDAVIRTKANSSSYSSMEGWNDAIKPDALHMYDYADEYGYKQKSASFIDGVILEDSVYSNRVLVAIDAFPWNGGVFSRLNINPYGQAQGGTNRTVAIGDGFCTIGTKKYLLLSSQNIKSGNINNNTDRARFDYVADIYGEKNNDGRYNIYQLNGTPNPYNTNGNQVDDSNLSLGNLSVYSLNEDYELFENGQMLYTEQLSAAGTSGIEVPIKIFYEASPLQMYNTSYIMLVESTDNGQTWQTNKIITGMVKRENSNYYITGPGSGIQIKNGPQAGRLIVPVYYQKNGSSYTEVIYSDDGGNTWSHGDPVPGFTGHESVVVELPNGSLQIFLRNSGGAGRIKTATSLDGGMSWTELKSALGDSAQGVACQISAIRYSGNIISAKDGQEYPAVIMSSAFNRSRTDGRIYIGLIKPNGFYPDGSTKYDIDWEYVYYLTESNALFAYSCLTELQDGRVAILYESSETSSWADGLRGIYYKEFSVDELIVNTTN